MTAVKTYLDSPSITLIDPKNLTTYFIILRTAVLTYFYKQFWRQPITKYRKDLQLHERNNQKIVLEALNIAFFIRLKIIN